MISSTDGFCSYIHFTDNDFGTPLKDQSIPILTKELESQSQSQSQPESSQKASIVNLSTGAAETPNPSPAKRSISQLVSEAATTVGKEKLKRRVQPTLVTSDQPK